MLIFLALFFLLFIFGTAERDEKFWTWMLLVKVVSGAVGIGIGRLAGAATIDNLQTPPSSAVVIFAIACGLVRVITFEKFDSRRFHTIAGIWEMTWVAFWALFILELARWISKA